MKITEVAILYEVSEETVRRWIWHHGLKATKYQDGKRGRPYDIHPEDLKNWCIEHGKEVRL